MANKTLTDEDRIKVIPLPTKVYREIIKQTQYAQPGSLMFMDYALKAIYDVANQGTPEEHGASFRFATADSGNIMKGDLLIFTGYFDTYIETEITVEEVTAFLESVCEQSYQPAPCGYAQVLGEIDS